MYKTAIIVVFAACLLPHVFLNESFPTHKFNRMPRTLPRLTSSMNEVWVLRAEPRSCSVPVTLPHDSAHKFSTKSVASNAYHGRLRQRVLAVFSCLMTTVIPIVLEIYAVSDIIMDTYFCCFLISVQDYMVSWLIFKIYLCLFVWVRPAIWIKWIENVQVLHSLRYIFDFIVCRLIMYCSEIKWVHIHSYIQQKYLVADRLNWLHQ